MLLYKPEVELPLSQDSDGSLSRKLETLNLAHGWLQQSLSLVGSDKGSVDEIRTHPKGEKQSCDLQETQYNNIYSSFYHSTQIHQPVM